MATITLACAWCAVYSRVATIRSMTYTVHMTCVELASHKRLFNPPPQFSRLGILVSLRPIFIFLVCDVHICVPLFVLVGITFLPLYSLASVLCTCISMYLHMHKSVCVLVINPRRACARVTVVGSVCVCVCVSVTQHLTLPMFVCLTNDTTYLTGDEGQKFCAVLSENAPLQG